MVLDIVVAVTMDETFHEISDVLDRIVREQEAELAAEENAAVTARPVIVVEDTRIN
ncbi:hypothetical protein [Kutzneria chonburiensis]|uniref:hypothetical protein n=1 Tax=Kutzneria chonburiensis TaxID=1483604 RepID=UPI00235E0DD4|nr:hypothetical protein [Kutzneria chonburiensis]